MRLSKLTNFDHFNVKGTQVEVNVSEWTSESAAIGKMHVVRVVVEGLPDKMKGYQALYEVGPNLGVVMEVDMPLVTAKDTVRMKIGMMDIKQFPYRLILFTPEALMYEACFTLEKVVEKGWFKDQQLIGQQCSQMRHGDKGDQKVENKCKQCMELIETTELLTIEQKKGECSQAQYPNIEQVDMLSEEDKNRAIQVLQDKKLAMALQEKETKGHTSDVRGCVSSKVECLAEIIKKTEKTASQDMIAGRELQEGQQDNLSEEGVEEEGDDGKLQLEESEELFDSQDFEDTFAKSIGVVLPEEEMGSQEEEMRTNKKVRNGDYKKTLEMAMNRKEAQNAFVNKEYGGKAKKVAMGSVAAKTSYK